MRDLRSDIIQNHLEELCGELNEVLGGLKNKLLKTQDSIGN